MSSLLLVSLSLAAQKKDSLKTTIRPSVIEFIDDSTNVVSLKDFNSFIADLKKGLSYEDYVKLTPEATLQQFWGYIFNKKKLQFKVRGL